jgi:hypothetical protein
MPGEETKKEESSGTGDDPKDKASKSSMDFSHHVSQHNTWHNRTGDDDDSDSDFDDSFAMGESESALDTDDVVAEEQKKDNSG